MVIDYDAKCYQIDKSTAADPLVNCLLIDYRTFFSKSLLDIIIIIRAFFSKSLLDITIIIIFGLIHLIHILDEGYKRGAW
jgi:hypothetical protein